MQNVAERVLAQPKRVEASSDNTVSGSNHQESCFYNPSYNKGFVNSLAIRQVHKQPWEEQAM